MLAKHYQKRALFDRREFARYRLSVTINERSEGRELLCSTFCLVVGVKRDCEFCIRKTSHPLPTIRLSVQESTNKVVLIDCFTSNNICYVNIS